MGAILATGINANTMIFTFACVTFIEPLPLGASSWILRCD